MAVGRIPRFRVGPRTRAFRRTFFPDAADAQWNDWRWQMRSSFKTLDGLARVFALSADERAAMERNGDVLPVAITRITPASSTARTPARDCGAR